MGKCVALQQNSFHLVPGSRLQSSSIQFEHEKKGNFQFYLLAQRTIVCARVCEHLVIVPTCTPDIAQRDWWHISHLCVQNKWHITETSKTNKLFVFLLIFFLHSSVRNDSMYSDVPKTFPVVFTAKRYLGARHGTHRVTEATALNNTTKLFAGSWWMGNVDRCCSWKFLRQICVAYEFDGKTWTRFYRRTWSTVTEHM